MNNRIIFKNEELLKIIGIDADILGSKISEYMSTIDNFPSDIIKYHHKSDDQIKFYNDFINSFGLEKLYTFHKIIIIELIHKFTSRVKKLKVPDSIINIFKYEHERIFNIIENDNDYIFDWPNDLFAKDMGICTFRLIPTGPCLLEISGYSRKVLFNEARRIIGNIWFFLFKAKGSKPFYEIHTHLGNLTEFNAEGWLRVYSRIAELLQMNPEIKGLMRGSWLVDPALSNVSPRLEYLRLIPCQNGARIFFIQNEGKNSGAFTKSETRKKLYAEGKYSPKAFLLVWPRNEIIKYALNNKHI